MSTKLFVGSLSWGTTDETLSAFFSTAGTVVSAKVITDRETGRSRGFGFVEMGSEAEAEKAMNELNGKELDGRAITVNEAKPQENRTGGGGNFRSGGGNGGGRGDYNKRGSGNRY